MTKVIAFYLPQFHTIPENDKWWGKGFTEWTNVKKAKSLFSGHNQPRAPYGDNYYRLDDVDSLRWQAGLMNQYGIDGMCFYHYWFNGKQLLQTPLSLLLANADISMPFCLSWANEPWTRAWDGGDKEVLMPQEYGNEADWKEHFEYLIKAFQDSRYIMFNGKPMFIIYRAASIPCLTEMLEYWRVLAVEHGFPGIHFVMMNTVFKDPYKSSGFDAALDFEPMYTIGHHLHGLPRYLRSLCIRGRRVFNRFLPSRKQPEDQISYRKIWQRILARPLHQGCYAGAFIDWDNTPRKAERGLVMHGACPKSFSSFFPLQYQRCHQQKIPFLFINAWNEWAEGTYLEPDSRHGYGYLDVIKRAKGL
jgi:hypothetical protein